MLLSPSASPTRKRGRVATHDASALLDLVALVARQAASDGHAPAAELVSMSAFNRVRAEADARRGLLNPTASPERTPTAEAIQMRFNGLAGHTVPWSDIVARALHANHAIWLSLLAQTERRDDLTDELVGHALGLVAARRGTTTLAMHDYEETRNALVSEDNERNGEEAMLAWVLPTADQVLWHCDAGWPSALALAGLAPRPSTKNTRQRLDGSALTPAEVTAFYAALNDRWPSRPMLWQFARSCGVRMHNVRWEELAEIRASASALLVESGLAPPTRTHTGGRKPLVYRYPAKGIPGAPRQVRGPRDSDAIRAERAPRRKLAVASLRVWLLSEELTPGRSRREYLAWQVGSGYPSASTFDKHGGFAALKREAAAENERARRAGDDPLAEALANVDALRRDLDTPTVQAEPFDFAKAMTAVLAGPVAEGSRTAAR